MSSGPLFAEVHNFVEWVEGNFDSVVNHMGGRACFISLKDHVDAIMNLGIVVCANRVRELVKLCEGMTIGAETPPFPSDEAVKWLYDSPQGRAASSPRY